jgi:dTDP-4-dehydrorhamnose reductase
MHLLITGAAGQLGQAVAAAAAGRVARLSACSHAHLNIGDGAAVEAAIAGLRPDVVINCAAYTAVDRAESEPALAFAVNAEGAATLARACRAVEALLLHVSTDYVFAGDGQHPLSEDDATGPRSAYGASKLAGETAIRETTPRHLIVRTSWLFGVHGGNFVKTIIRAARCRPELRVVDDQWGCPTPADALGQGLLTAATGALADPHRCGTYHFAGQPPATWYQLAAAALHRAADLGAIGRLPRLQAIPTAAYPTPARRPAYSVLDCRKWVATFGGQPPLWQPALDAVIAAAGRG